MTQEVETQKFGTTNSGSAGGFSFGNGIGRSSKKQKQRKVPQRGLGVAQLEKIRLEEQLKKDRSIILPSPPSISPTKPPIKIYQSYTSLIPYPCFDVSPTNPILVRTQNCNTLSSNTVSSVNSVAWQSVSIQGRGNVPKLWNSDDYNPGKEGFGINPGLGCQSGGLNLPFEFNNIWPLPCLMQRAQHQKHPSSSSSFPSSSKVNVSSSLLNFEMEPPSNQSHYGNYTSTFPVEDKMVGRKRPYPFSLDSLPGPSFHYKLPPSFLPPISRSDGSVFLGNGATLLNSDPSKPNFREGPSISNCVLGRISKKCIEEKGAAIGEFLTLAPPTTTMACPQLKKSKALSAYLALANIDTLDFDSLPYQAFMEDLMHQPGHDVTSQQQPYYYRFLPPAMAENGQATKTIHRYNGGEIGESVDLNLKL